MKNYQEMLDTQAAKDASKPDSRYHRWKQFQDRERLRAAHEADPEDVSDAALSERARLRREERENKQAFFVAALLFALAMTSHDEIIRQGGGEGMAILLLVSAIIGSAWVWEKITGQKG